jgi:hypothetical protein
MFEANLLLAYQRKWVALAPDRSKVLDSANGLKELSERIEK